MINIWFSTAFGLEIMILAPANLYAFIAFVNPFQKSPPLFHTGAITHHQCISAPSSSRVHSFPRGGVRRQTTPNMQ